MTSGRLDFPYLDKDPTDPDVTRLDRNWLSDQSKDELINIILELKATLPEKTARFVEKDILTPRGAVGDASGADAVTEKYVRLPAHTSHQREPLVKSPWRVQLVSADLKHEPLWLEICGDVFVGRQATGIKPDLDLSAYGAEELGVSRQHALLRPTPVALYLIDLGSTNGTAFNGRKIDVGVNQQVRHKDMISFGGLHFSLRIVGKPGEPDKW